MGVLQMRHLALRAVPMTPESVKQYDCVAILTDHTAFDIPAIVAAAPLVVDTRNAVKKPASHVFRLGAPAVKTSERQATVGQ